jgi:hypothetical protein
MAAAYRRDRRHTNVAMTTAAYLPPFKVNAAVFAEMLAKPFPSTTVDIGGSHQIGFTSPVDCSVCRATATADCLAASAAASAAILALLAAVTAA